MTAMGASSSSRSVQMAERRAKEGFPRRAGRAGLWHCAGLSYQCMNETPAARHAVPGQQALYSLAGARVSSGGTSMPTGLS